MVVAEAKPAITCVAVITCFKSKNTVVFADIEVAGIITVPASETVKVPAVAAVLATTMLVTMVVVLEGTVYKVVFDVDAEPLNSIEGVVAI